MQQDAPGPAGDVEPPVVVESRELPGMEEDDEDVPPPVERSPYRMPLAEEEVAPMSPTGRTGDVVSSRAAEWTPVGEGSAKRWKQTTDIAAIFEAAVEFCVHEVRDSETVLSKLTMQDIKNVVIGAVVEWGTPDATPEERIELRRAELMKLKNFIKLKDIELSRLIWYLEVLELDTMQRFLQVMIMTLF